MSKHIKFALLRCKQFGASFCFAIKKCQVIADDWSALGRKKQQAPHHTIILFL